MSLATPTPAIPSSSSAAPAAGSSTPRVEYLDFLSGIAVNNLGHCHPKVVAAVQEQVGRLIHVSNLFYTDANRHLAVRLASRSLGGSVLFCNSGAEANEAAIKLVRKFRPRGDVIVALNAFHGRTYGALSATPQEAKQAPFAPLVPGFRAMDAAEIPSPSTKHGRRPDRADPGRVGRQRVLPGAAGLDPRGLRRGRRGAGLRRGPVPGWAAPARCGPTSRSASCRTR